jgi:hypothetical protein
MEVIVKVPLRLSLLAFILSYKVYISSYTQAGGLVGLYFRGKYSEILKEDVKGWKTLWALEYPLLTSRCLK